MASIRDFLLQNDKGKEPNQDFYNDKCDYLLEFMDDFTNGGIILTEAFENGLRACRNERDAQKLIFKFLNSHVRVTKMVQDIICDNISGKSTKMGIKLSKSLIRVAATRIFAEPEQSIMELPINSIDSYNSGVENSFSVGKFGMGFFSILYWIAQASDGNYLRSIEIVSSFRENGKILTYSCHLSWTTEGLKAVMWYRSPQSKTGTKISVSCDNHRLSSENISKMHSYIDRLSDVPGVAIFCNDKIINNSNSNRKVFITLTDSLIEVEDFAKGISPSVIESSLLVPTSSTKLRSFDIPQLIQFKITPNGKDHNVLKILISGVCIMNVVSEETSTLCVNYIINLPHNSRVPVSRDDVIFDKDSLELMHFISSAKQILNVVISTTSNILPYISLLKKYGAKNKSPYLNKEINVLISSLKDLPHIFVPKLPFWQNFTKHVRMDKRIIFYDSSLIFDAEQKFITQIKSYVRCYENIFRFRTVVVLDFLDKDVSETGGFVNIIFIKNVDRISIKHFIMTHTESLLVPHDEIVDSKLPFEPRSDLSKILHILYMTYERKTCTFVGDIEMNNFNKHIQVFAELNLSPKFMNTFFTMFCSKIADSKIKKNYGSKYYQAYHTFFIPNEWDFEFPEVYVIDLHQIQQKLLEFFIAVYPRVHYGAYRIPNYNDFLIIFDDNRLKDEFSELEGMCPGNGELFIINLILRDIDFRQVLTSYDNIDGICSYILSELRKDFSNSSIERHTSSFYSTGSVEISSSFKLKIIDKIFESGMLYLKLKNEALPRTTDFVITDDCVFSCKSLIKDIFTQEGSDIMFEKSTETYKTFNPKSMNMQIVEIAVNDGTNKSFVPSILTELIQNSIDAIRTSGSNNRIDISVGGDFVSIRDSVGIDDISQILVPFLSTKDPNDPRVTGEMGTGFFNVYRQPYVKCVKLESLVNEINIEVLCIPKVENGFVTDIVYHLRQLENTTQPYTNITIVFNNDVNILSSVIIEAQLFSRVYLSFVNVVEIYLNGKHCTIESKPVYEQVGIGEFRVAKSRTAISFILTNGIPFSPLQDVDLVPEDLISTLAAFGSNSIVINLSKNVYSPTQSRNKISIYPNMVKEVKFFITNGIIRSIFQKYIDKDLDTPDEIIEHTESKSSIYQVKPVNGSNIFMNYKFARRYMGVNGLNVGDTIRYVIDLFNSGAISDIDKLPHETLYEKVVYRWFQSKNTQTEARSPLTRYETPNSLSHNEYLFVSKAPILLSMFVESYWKHTKALVESKVIKGISMLKASPSLYFDETHPGIQGFFSPFKNHLVLSNKYFSVDDIEEKLKMYTYSDFNYLDFCRDPILKQYFSNSIPSCVLIHELTHAILNTSYNSSDNGTHGKTSITVGNHAQPDFEDAASGIYSLLISDGLMETFASKIRNRMKFK